MPKVFIDVYVFIIGLCVGSFLNVCIYRLPAGRSIVRPASACGKCGTAIRWYDNLPIVSYIILRGRCRACGASFSIRYPLVELLTGLSALAVWQHMGGQPQSVIYFLFIAALLTITFIDIDHRIIPDSISLPGIPIGLLFCLFQLIPSMRWLDSLLGILCGGGSLFVVAWTYQLLTGKEGMGGGDIKLLAMIGAFIGWKGVLFTIMASSFIGTLVGVAVMLSTRQGMKLAVPFGPFLAMGAVLYLFFGPQLIGWYLNGFSR
ncbi:MAG: prepilin peptidase [Desulfobacteraceae bacterium]|nr:prepilin peptidase [Desulfobacteraceae bacterium]